MRNLILALAFSAVTGSAMSAEIRDLTKVPPPNISGFNMTGPGAPAELSAQLARAIGLDPASSLSVVRVLPLPNNAGATLRLEQRYNNVPVWGQQIIAEQSSDGRIVGLSGTAAFNIGQTQAPASAQLTPEQALQKAKEVVRSTTPTVDGSKYENEETNLVYLVQEAGNMRLVYRTSFYTTVQEATGLRPTRPVIFIDATSGETVSFYENIQHAQKGTGPGGNAKTGRYDYGGGTFPPYEVTEQSSNCNMDSSNVFTENLNGSASGTNTPFQFACYNNTVKQINGAYSPLNDAHSFGKVVFDMYNDWYGTSPLRQKLQLRVHYLTNYENAFWNGSSMTFGDGATRFYPLVSMDVTAHEVSHGFTEQNSGLIYQKQSGGMNEAFSDMAGESAEYYYVQKYGAPFGRPMPDLETGADIFKQAGSALRYMCNPPQDGRSIGHVRDYTDALDVHYSSGVYNKVFCLLSKRSGWNAKKTFDVFVLANQHYWTPNATFQSGAEGVLKAAVALNYPTADVIYAFDQVGITLGTGPAKTKYFYNTLRVIADGNPRGCSANAWDCMTNLCKGDLQDQNAWRGWAGCWQKSGKYICYFECSQVRQFF